MGGFSDEWLALREPVDAAARDRALIHDIARRLAGARTIHVADLGCGTGSLLRALAPQLPATDQHWTLVDGDPDLLAAARARLADWADAAREDGPVLRMEKDGCRIAVAFRIADLVREPLPVPEEGVDLVAATAMFDLVSAEWASMFVARLARRRLPLYAALNFDGQMAWTPAHPFDARAAEGLARHQRRDKGFGAALGPEAAPTLARMLEPRGYRVATADSPWRMTGAQAALTRALIEGCSAALGELHDLEPAEIAAWAAARCDAAGTGTGRIGHVDLLAWPA